MGLKFSRIKAELIDSRFSGKVIFYNNFPDRKIIGIKKIEELGKFYDSACLYVGCFDESINFDEYENLSLLIYGDDNINLNSKPIYIKLFIKNCLFYATCISQRTQRKLNT